MNDVRDLADTDRDTLARSIAHQIVRACYHEKFIAPNPTIRAEDATLIADQSYLIADALIARSKKP